MEDNNQLEQLDKIVSEYEKNLSWKRGGTIDERVYHVLGQYRQIADNSVFQAKNFLNDVKVQFKALEIITEGITGQDLNHGQKRVIANHIIGMLRKMVDRIDQTEFTFNTNIFERFNFFRSETPESRLYENHRQLKYKTEQQDALLKKLREEHPDIFKDDLPF